jgi:ribonuclease HII
MMRGVRTRGKGTSNNAGPQTRATGAEEISREEPAGANVGATKAVRVRATATQSRRRPPRPGSQRERTLWESGYRLVAGVDEVGRGAWAGPLSVGVAVVCEPLARLPRGLRDSKVVLEDDRERMFDKVAAWCTAWAVGHAWPEECDRYGMTCALVLATRRALARISPHLLPEAIVLDGKFDFVSRACFVPEDEPEERQDVQPSPLAHLPDISGAELPDGFAPVVHTLVKADAKCVSVAAASVLAKVTRDRLMRSCAESYPPFDFALNKGYPSPTHKRALRGYGLTAIHRRSWVFVENLPWADPFRIVRLRPEGLGEDQDRFDDVEDEQDVYRIDGREEAAVRSGDGDGLFREAQNTLTDDVAKDLVCPAGDAHRRYSEQVLRPGEGSPFP